MLLEVPSHLRNPQTPSEFTGFLVISDLEKVGPKVHFLCCCFQLC
jgi:hypothetical protein